MRQWDKLSFELLTIIFAYLNEHDLKDLISSQFVCKNWRDPAQRIMYKEISFHSSVELKKLVETLPAYSQPFRNTQKVSFRCSLHEIKCNSDNLAFFAASVQWILQYCTNLKTVTLPAPLQSKTLYKSIHSHKGKKLCLETIPEPRCNLQREATEYGLAAWRLRDTLTSLTITNNGSVPYIDFYSDDESTTMLYLFPRLRHVNYHFEEDEYIHLRKVFLSIKSQKLINSVNIKLYYEPSYKPTLNHHYDLQAILTNIRTLIISNAICGDSLVNYIIHTFDNLNRCTIYFNRTEKVGVLSNLSHHLDLKRDTCIKFMKYLNRLKHYDVKHVFVEDITDAMATFLPSILRTLRLTITYHESRNQWSMENCGGTHELKIGFQSKHIGYEDKLPLEVFFEIFGSSVQHLTLNTAVTLSDDFSHRMLRGFALHYILDACNSLQSLRLEKTLVKLSIIESSSTSLRKITFSGCVFNDAASVTQLSNTFPRIRLFHWDNSSFVHSKHIWEITMENTAFENLVIEESEDKYRKIYVRLYIKTLDKTRYILFDQRDEFEGVKMIEEAELIDDFEELEHYNLLLVDIKCKDMEILGIRTSSLDTVFPLINYDDTFGSSPGLVNYLL